MRSYARKVRSHPFLSIYLSTIPPITPYYTSTPHTYKQPKTNPQNKKKKLTPTRTEQHPHRLDRAQNAPLWDDHQRAHGLHPRARRGGVAAQRGEPRVHGRAHRGRVQRDRVSRGEYGVGGGGAWVALSGSSFFSFVDVLLLLCWGVSHDFFFLEQSFCDPRLNFEQSLDVAFLISNHFKKERVGAYKSDGDVLFEELGGRSPA